MNTGERNYINNFTFMNSDFYMQKIYCRKVQNKKEIQNPLDDTFESLYIL